MNRREFMKGLAATSALVTPAVCLAKLVEETPAFIGFDFGSPGGDFVAILQMWEDGRLAVRRITGIEFYESGASSIAGLV